MLSASSSSQPFQELQSRCGWLAGFSGSAENDSLSLTSGWEEGSVLSCCADAAVVSTSFSAVSVRRRPSSAASLDFFVPAPWRPVLLLDVVLRVRFCLAGLASEAVSSASADCSTGSVCSSMTASLFSGSACCLRAGLRPRLRVVPSVSSEALVLLLDLLFFAVLPDSVNGTASCVIEDAERSSFVSSVIKIPVGRPSWVA